MIIRAGHILKSHQQNCFIFGKRLPSGNRGSANFQVTYHQNCLIFAKISVRDIGAGQIIKSHQQNCFILGESLLCDNRGSANCQMTSSKLPYFAKV